MQIAEKLKLFSKERMTETNNRIYIDVYIINNIN